MKLRNLPNTLMMLRGPSVCFAPEGEEGGAPAGGEGEGGAAAPVPATEHPSEGALPKDLADILSFDPFAKPASEPKTEPQSSGQQTDGGATTSDPSTQPAVAGAPGQDKVLENLVEVQAKLLDRLDKGTTPEPKTDPKAEVNPFDGVNVPQELVNAIYSEDPQERQTGVTLLVRGAAMMALKVAREEMANLASSFPSMMAEHSQAIDQAQKVKTDFYGKYPELDKPILHNMVGMAAVAVAQEMGKSFTGWNDTYRDKVAAKVLESIGGLKGHEPQAQPTPKQPFTPSGGSRPAPTPKNDIMDTLFG